MPLSTSRKHAIVRFLFFWGLQLTVSTTTAWVMMTPHVTSVSGRTRTDSVTTSTNNEQKRNTQHVRYHSHHLASTRRLRALDLMSDTEEQQQQSVVSPTELVDESITLMKYQPHQNEHLSILFNHPQVKKLLAISDEPGEDELSVQQKVINLVFLSAAFGYAIYTIFNIDNGMTRGWTVQEQVMRIPLDNWGAYESYLANKPIITKTLINVIIYLLGDWLSQTAFQKKHVLDFDISRTLRNGFIGLCFGPLVHQYYEFSDAILPPENGVMTRVEKIFMDQTIYLTVKCSIYISAVGLLAGEEWPTVKQTVKDKIVGIVFTAWKFWPIVHCITYR
jgi:protein Mpv17